MGKLIPFCASWFLLCWTAFGGNYSTGFGLPDQVLAFDNAPTGTGPLAPASLWRGTLGDDTTLAIVNHNLVAGDPTGGAWSEYSAFALYPEIAGASYSAGSIRATVAGDTIQRVRDGGLPGLAVGLAVIDGNTGSSYFLAAVNRTTVGPKDFFDQSALGGMANTGLLVKGTGYFAVWQVVLSPADSRVVAVQAIPAGPLADTQLRIDFAAGPNTSFYVSDVPLVAAHTLATLPTQIGAVVISWGTQTGNPPYSGVTFRGYSGSGPEVPDGAVGLPATGYAGIALLLAAMGIVATLVLKRAQA